MSDAATDKLDIEGILNLLRRLDDPADIDAIIRDVEARLSWEPYAHQQIPTGEWAVRLLMGGRGSGKTDAGAYDLNEHAAGPPCDPKLKGGHRMSIVAPTLGDAAESCVNGPSGIRAHNPDAVMVGAVGGTVVRWPNGSEAKLFGGSSPRDIERFRAGGNRCRAWIEEAAAIPYFEAIWEQIPFGHRLGRNPQVIMTTTPKPRAALRDLAGKARAWDSLDRPSQTRRWDRVIVTHATTDDNPALDPDVRAGLYDLYSGTRLGQQELLGLLLEDFEGALWTRERVEELAVLHEDLPEMRARTVGIDPSAWGVKALQTGSVPPPGSIGRGVETGVVVSGIASDRQVYTVADYSGRMTPNEWANRAIDAAVRWKAYRIVPETNMGGPLVVANIQAALAARRVAGEQLPQIVVDPVHASDGKRVRAEPVAGLTEQGRHHFAGVEGLGLLIDQMCGWDPNEPWSPDRLDAMVHGVTRLAPWRTVVPTRMVSRPRGEVPR